ncbi:helix-turn-helix domain-containing protein, partial [Rhodococcus rhodnii]
MSKCDDSPWMTVAEAAAYMRRHPKTVLRMLYDGELAGYQATEPNGRWRIHRDDADNALRGHRPPHLR